MAEDIRRNRLIIFLSVTLVVVAIIVILALTKQAPAVQIVKVTRGDLNETITSNGKVEPISAQVAHAEFPTFVTKVMATEGQAVHRGEVILTLDDSDARSQLAQARAELLAAQSDLASARAGGSPDQVTQLRGTIQQEQLEVASLERTGEALQQLVAKQAATQDDLDQNRAALAQAQARLKELEQRKQIMAQQATIEAQSDSLKLNHAQAQVQSLEEKVRSATVISSVDGTLYSLPVRTGDFVKIGDVLAEMADLRNVRVRAFVDEPDLGWLEPNQAVEVTWDAKPGSIWNGHTEQIPKEVVPHGMRSVGEVLCSVDNTKLELLPNINVEVRILVRKRPDALILPRAAVHEEDGRHYVFVVREERIHRQDITVGLANASQYEVVTGLNENDEVALSGDSALRDGMEIRPTEAR